MPYELRIEQHPTYLQATATGPHNAENALRFLRESFEACQAGGFEQLLLDMRFEGKSLDSGAIYGVVAQRTEAAASLRRIAWVDSSERDPMKRKFAETVAVNRGVNVKLFSALAEAKAWLEQPLSRSDP